MNKNNKIGLIVILLICIYFIGPKVDEPKFVHNVPPIEMSLLAMEDSLNQSEHFVSEMKKDNQARIVWFDSLKKEKTPVAIVYLHGFTASQEEGAPVHRMLSKKYGCNLYLARLNKHGRNKKEPLQFMTATELYEDAIRAIAIGKKLGEEVIVISTSTGGTLSLLYSAFHDDLKGIINYSPNIRIRQKVSYLLDKPWGLQFARAAYQGIYKYDECDEYGEKYWNCKTRLEAIIELQSLVDHSMIEENFRKISTPSLTAYYFKDKENQDPTVSAQAIEWMHGLLGTPEDKKWLRSFPEAGSHVIANPHYSKAWEAVYETSCEFIEKVLEMEPSTPQMSHL